ncbi:MAG TPA: hypothetical protein VF005_07695 [Acidimicrobiales bacterium]
MTTASRDGIDLNVPNGWDARIYRRPPAPSETTNSVLHAGNFALPETRGDFGSGAVERMGPSDVLVVLFEYDPAAARTPLFARSGQPQPVASDFAPNQLQRFIPGQSGAQFFYNEAGRALCLYVVLGSHSQRAALVNDVRRLLSGLQVQPRVSR